MRRPAAARASALVLLLASACTPALAKVEQGTLKIDSVTTEQLIGKFGVAESGDVQLKLTTSRDGWERGRHELHVLFFHDDNYRKWEKSIQAGSLCRDRNKIADIEHKVDLPHEHATHHGHGWEYFVDPETGKSYRVNLDTGESEWNSPHNATRMREEGPVNRIHHRETVFSTKLEHHYPSRGRDRGVKVAKATHWYVVVSDCALEFYEAHPPPMRYELTMFNGGSHLPSDLNGMGVLYFFALLALLLGAGPAFALRFELAPAGIADADPAVSLAALNAGVERIARRDGGNFIMVAADVPIDVEAIAQHALDTADDDVVITGAEVDDFVGDVLEHNGSGRLLRRDPDGDVHEVLGGLSFANGVALVRDDEAGIDEVWVAETAAYAIHRVQRSGPDAGAASHVTDSLPGFPDNLAVGADGTVWAPLPNPRNPIGDKVKQLPGPFREVVRRIPDAITDRLVVPYARVLGFAPDGTVRHDLQGTGEACRFLTGAREHDGHLYLGSVDEEVSSIVRVAVPEPPAAVPAGG